MPITNTLLVRAAYGWDEVTRPSSIATYGRRESLYGLGANASPADVVRTANGRLDIVATPRFQYDAEQQPPTDAQLAYHGYGVGDTLPMTVAAGSVTERVISIAVSEDDNSGQATVTPSLHDVVMYASPIENFVAMLGQAVKKMIPGTGRGDWKEAQPVTPPAIPAPVSAWVPPAPTVCPAPAHLEHVGDATDLIPSGTASGHHVTMPPMTFQGGWPVMITWAWRRVNTAGPVDIPGPMTFSGAGVFGGSSDGVFFSDGSFNRWGWVGSARSVGVSTAGTFTMTVQFLSDGGSGHYAFQTDDVIVIVSVDELVGNDVVGVVSSGQYTDGGGNPLPIEFTQSYFCDGLMASAAAFSALTFSTGDDCSAVFAGSTSSGGADLSLAIQSGVSRRESGQIFMDNVSVSGSTPGGISPEWAADAQTIYAGDPV